MQRSGRVIAYVLVLLGLGCSDDDDPAGTGGAGGSAGSAGNAGTGGGGAGGFGGQPSACGPLIEGSRCLDNGWCWDGPRPLGSNLHAIDGTPDGTSIWAVGSLGGAFRYCEGGWLPMETGTDATLHDVWHPSPDLAIAVGEKGSVLRWDGKDWNELASGTEATLQAVWGSAPDDVWIGGRFESASSPPVLLHFDGGAFERVALPDGTLNAWPIYSISGRSADDVFVAGGETNFDAALHFDGKSWELLPSASAPFRGPFTEIVAYDGGPTLALYASGITLNVIYEFTDAAWDSSYSHEPFDSLRALFRDASGQPAIAQRSSEDATTAELLSFDGNEWLPSGDTLAGWPRAIWSATSSAAGFAVGDGTSLLGRGSDGVWAKSADVGAIAGEPIFLGGRAGDDLWLITESELHQRGASGWTRVATFSGRAHGGAVDLAGRPYVDTLDSQLLHHDGTSLRSLPYPGGLRKLLAVAANDIWAAGTQGSSSEHFDGTSWTRVPMGCSSGSYQASRFRRAPDGNVFLASEIGALTFDLANQTCTRAATNSAGFFESPLVDLAWTPSGELWGITRLGELYQGQGSVFVSRGALFPPDPTVAVQELVAISETQLRVVYVDDTSKLLQIATIDLAGTPAIGTKLVAPAEGPLWTADATHVTAAILGGVLRHGYAAD